MVQNDFVITDFEGEPARPLAQRREKQSPLKDVAGMLRSFDYAMHTALRRVTERRPDLAPALAPLAQDWQQLTVAAFMEEYRRAASAAGLYPGWSAAESMLSFFMLEKALYELRYEVENRPDWVAIPLRGLAAAVGT